MTKFDKIINDAIEKMHKLKKDYCGGNDYDKGVCAGIEFSILALYAELKYTPKKRKR